MNTCNRRIEMSSVKNRFNAAKKKINLLNNTHAHTQRFCLYTISENISSVYVLSTKQQNRITHTHTHTHTTVRNREMSIIKTCARKLICMRGGQTHTHVHYLQTFELLVNGLQGPGSARLIIIGVTISLNCQSKQRGETKRGLILVYPHTHLSSLFPSSHPWACVTVQGYSNSSCSPELTDIWIWLRNAMTSPSPWCTGGIQPFFHILTGCILMLDTARITHTHREREAQRAISKENLIKEQ